LFFGIGLLTQTNYEEAICYFVGAWASYLYFIRIVGGLAVAIGIFVFFLVIIFGTLVLLEVYTSFKFPSFFHPSEKSRAAREAQLLKEKQNSL
jgi:hypothetical protein